MLEVNRGVTLVVIHEFSKLYLNSFHSQLERAAIIQHIQSKDSQACADDKENIPLHDTQDSQACADASRSPRTSQGRSFLVKS